MSKSFTDHERSIIRDNLILACKECWYRYGYQKTNVRELAVRADISAGSFYQFYTSKELLFVDTAEIYEKEMIEKFHSCMAKYPGKHGLAEAMKEMAKMISTLPWFTSMLEDWPVILRKLPPDYAERDFMQGMSQMKEIIDTYKMKPTLGIEKTTHIIDVLVTCVLQQQNGSEGSGDARDYIIDCVVDSLFE